MNLTKEERDLIRKNLRLAKWKKGKPLSKEEGHNILQAHLHTTLKKEEPQNFKPATNEPASISDILTKLTGEQHD